MVLRSPEVSQARQRDVFNPNTHCWRLFDTFLVGFLRFYAEIFQNGTFRALFAGAADADDIGPL